MTRTLAATAAALIAFSAAFVAVGPKTALAPEPAKLSAALPASSSASASATYLNTNVPTQVRFYSASWTGDSRAPAAGTPCTTVGLARDALAYQVIQRQVLPSGFIYARCV